MGSLGIHDGTFHADEVTACALLILYEKIDRDKVVRTRELEQLGKCDYVCDVGGVFDPAQKRFDHHQSDYNGPLSSAGMILNYLLDEQIIEPAWHKFLADKLITGVDTIDNGGYTPPNGLCTFSGVISEFVPVDHDSPPQAYDDAFFEALDFCMGHLKRLRARFDYIQEAKVVVQKAMESQGKVLYFDRSLPWLESFFELGGEHHPAEFIIMPAGKHWKLRGIPPTYDRRMEVRRPLPEKWAGLLEGELKKVSGIDGAIFCHKGQFISIWQTKEDAEKAFGKIYL